MLRAEYDSILYAYESSNVDILEIIGGNLLVTMEAAEDAGATNQSVEVKASNAVADTVKSDETSQMDKTSSIQKAITKIQALLKKIGGILDLLKRKIENRLRQLQETDKGFQNLYYKRKSMIKPQENMKVISYEYSNDVLDRPMEKLLSEIITCLDKLKAADGGNNSNTRISEILEANQGQMTQVLLSPYVKNGSSEGESITSVPAFIKYLVKEYRGEKKEVVYRDTQLGQIEALALSTKNLRNKFTGYIRMGQDSYNKIKSLQYQIKRSSADQKVVDLITTNASRAAVLFNAYNALVNAYYELKLEQALNYRIILRKFYQF